MTHTISIIKQLPVREDKILEEYWCMRGITRTNNTLSVCKEKELPNKPELEEIAQFLSDSNADFVSVEHNYRFEPDLPFC